MKIVNRLLKIGESMKIGESKEVKYDDTFGFLTGEDMKKLREATQKPSSPHRKRHYITWDCAKCGHEFFYHVMKCPLCESKIIARKHATRYAPRIEG
ncbi:MAG: hypothetical protein HY518_00805 [Candidatus Aenigmarchaeota archaeon]|nr:hypothetical protein [Candidatus Aenigmarchaeota archaeon]